MGGRGSPWWAPGAIALRIISARLDADFGLSRVRVLVSARLDGLKSIHVAITRGISARDEMLAWVPKSSED